MTPEILRAEAAKRREKLGAPATRLSQILDGAADEIEGLRAAVRQLGEMGDVCTYDTLGEICSTCRCKRHASSVEQSMRGKEDAKTVR